MAGLGLKKSPNKGQPRELVRSTNVRHINKVDEYLGRQMFAIL
jgi:hypothetical protein